MSEHMEPETGEIIIKNGIEMSSSVGKIMEAIAAAQGEIENAGKDAKNPHFGSKYATLAAIYDACRASLSKNGVAVVQAPYNAGTDIGVATMLGHKSGEWLKSTLCVKPMKFDAQGAGSVITYLRRYSLAAMVGVAPEDDDGEAAVGRPDSKPQRTAAPARATNGNGGDERATKARSYAQEAMAKCRAFKDGKTFDDWHAHNRNAIAAVRDLDPALHGQLLAAVSECQKKFDPANLLAAG